MESAESHSAAAATGADPASPGELLAGERKRLGLSVADVASKMRMGVSQVEALERADYAKLPAGTFLRGFVRSYAKLLGLDPERVLKLLEATHRTQGSKPAIVVQSQNIRYTAPGEQFATPRARASLVAVIVLALAAGGWYWWNNIRPQQLFEARSPVPAEKIVVAPQAEPVSLPAAQPADGTAIALSLLPRAAENRPTQLRDEPVTQPFNAAETKVAVMASAEAIAQKPILPVKVLTQGMTDLAFRFTGESWVEVVDGNGRTLISRRFKSGDEDEVSGRGPISVVIGNAPNTRMTYNGTEFDLEPHTRVAVARFTLK